MTVSYRFYQSGDEREIVRLWNVCLPQDPISALRFRNLTLLDANFDPEGFRIAVSNEKIIGCLYAVRRLLPLFATELEPDNAWIPHFFVDPNFRKQGIATRLLQDALEFLGKQGRKQVFFASYAPNYILPGIDPNAYPQGYEFLLKHGFAIQYSPVAMDCSLVGYELPQDVVTLKEKRESEGYTFNVAEVRDLYEVIRFATKMFNPDWGRAIREGILQGLPLSRILIARHEGKLAGFCLHGGYEGVAERFGPFGVDPDEQGKSLGKILLYECLALMRRAGLHGAWFLWTGEESPAGYLYKRAGFKVTRRFHVMRKELS